MRTTTALLCAATLGLAGCATVNIPSAEETVKLETVYFWQDESLTLIKKYQLNAVRAGRVLAYLHQMVNRIASGDLPKKVSASCVNVALDDAASQLLEYFFPYETPGRLRALAQLRIGDRTDCRASHDAATSVAESTTEAATQDGMYPPRRIRENPAPRLGSWVPTPPTFSPNPTEPFAENWRPFLLDRVTDIRIAPPPPASSTAYRAAVEELVAARKSLSAGNKALAESWHLEAGSATPPGVWNPKIRQLIDAAKLEPLAAIRLLAAANMAMHDAFIACWHLRYAYWVERPISAAARLGYLDFVPLLVTPSFPGYPSGLACTSGAVTMVAAAYMPAHAHTLAAMADEAGESRIYGGIHFRFDIEAGLDAGRQVGAIAARKMPPQ